MHFDIVIRFMINKKTIVHIKMKSLKNVQHSIKYKILNSFLQLKKYIFNQKKICTHTKNK